MIKMKYRNRLELYGSFYIENELGEIAKEYRKIKDVYCNIIPQHGGTFEMSDTGLQGAYTIQRIFVRKKSIKDPKIDMYFKDEQGNKYEVLDFFLNYKNNAEWEFRTRINYE